MASAPQPNPIPYGKAPTGIRIRKSTDYIRHYNPELRALFEPGDMILVEPRSEYGVYVISPVSEPEVLSDKYINIATKWSAPLTKMNSDGTAGTLTGLVNDLNVNRLQFAHYKIYAKDPGFQFKVAQPGAKYKFSDKFTRKLSVGNTFYHYAKRNFGAMTEIFVIQQDSPITVEVNSTNMRENSFWVRLGVIGYKYQLLRISVDDIDDDPRIITTIYVGERQ